MGKYELYKVIVRLGKERWREAVRLGCMLASHAGLLHIAGLP